MATRDYDEFVMMLHELIGMRGHYSGEEYQLVEIIDHSTQGKYNKGPSIVLKPASPETVIQDSMFGEARRNVEPTFTISALSEVKHEQLHPSFAEFVGPEIQRMLEASIHHTSN